MDSVRVSSTKSPLKGKQLKDIVTAAVCETFGVEMPSQEDLKKLAKERQSSGKQAREELLQELLVKGGVKKFNARTPAEIAKAGSFAKTDFAGTRLSGVKFPKLDLQSANFDGAVLAKVKFQQCKCHRADLSNSDFPGGSDIHLDGTDVRFEDVVGCNLDGAILENACIFNLGESSLRNANCREIRLDGDRQGRGNIQCDFTGADLTQAAFNEQNLSGAIFLAAKLVQANLRECKLRNVNLTNADLRRADLRGADLTRATVAGANFEGAKLLNVKLDGVDSSKAKGLDPTKTKPPALGPGMGKLEAIARKANVPMSYPATTG